MSVSPSTSSLTRCLFYYDILSPYSYIAFEVILRYAAQWQLDVVLCPIFLGGIMKGAKNSPPGFVPNKAAYMKQDLKRLSDYWRIPLKFPTGGKLEQVMMGSLQPMRLITAVQIKHPDKVEVLSRLFWQRHWCRDEVILDKQAQLSMLEECRIPDATHIYDLAQNDELVKSTLTKRTEDALSFGAFGAPTMVFYLQNEKKPHMLFGSDRFHVIAHMLKQEFDGPFPKSNTKQISSKL